MAKSKTSGKRNAGASWDLLAQAEAGSVEGVERCLADGAYPKFQPREGDPRGRFKGVTPLIAAARGWAGDGAGCVKILAPLSDVHAADAEGWDALGAAVEGGCHESVGLLLALAANPCRPRTDGGTHLLAALGHGPAWIECVRLLAPVSRLGFHGGRSPLAVAVERRWTEAVEALAPLGHLEARDAMGRSALAVAAQLGRPCEEGRWGAEETLVELLRHGARPGARDKNGRSALWWAASRGCLPDVLALMTAGADWRTADEAGVDAMGAATSKGAVACVEHFAQRAMEEGEASSEWLIGAAQGGHCSAARALLRWCDPRAIDGMGRTALMWAAQRGAGDVVQLLAPLSDILAVDARGQSAATLASPGPLRDWIEAAALMERERGILANAAKAVGSVPRGRI